MKRFSERFKLIDVNSSDSKLNAYLSNEIDSDLEKFGAILIRNTPINNYGDLEKYGKIFIKKPYLAYVGGVVPRKNYSKYVFNSTELNGLFKIKLHNELAYQENAPDRIAFFCEQQPLIGGETPIAHEKDITGHFSNSLKKFLDKKKIVYIRRYFSKEKLNSVQRLFSPFFLTWQDAFSCEKKDHAELKCKELNLKFSWIDAADTLEVRSEFPIFVNHEILNKKVFFNQIFTQNHNRYSLGSLVYYTYKVLGINSDNAPRNTIIDGQELEKKDLYSLYTAYNNAERSFKWKNQDLLILDNKQVLHARNTFVGKRKICVMMGNN
ncbi:hypothetical protein AV645_10260 [Acinetobacter calcoaceticus]|uniref:TauD/TfdA-like domain-containing protein n=1 Tax=Acinetobacter oleivorans TaxID=1148157 RepID=A0A0B2U914_9GAMM|nr:TauD/TfdA family dioxygenase [Acinetobacter calcoaceticus]KHN65863.1 hypothetical protein DH17_05900 [Acinetobacter oleivorans]KUM12025.1 hypothetical protein AV645_10260 [Acinetobacter calcoaceticus]